MGQFIQSSRFGGRSVILPPISATRENNSILTFPAKHWKIYQTSSEVITRDQEKGYVLLAGNLNARTSLLQEASSNRSGIPGHTQRGTELLSPRASEHAESGQNLSDSRSCHCPWQDTGGYKRLLHPPFCHQGIKLLRGVIAW
jgi:hypothetical protein